MGKEINFKCALCHISAAGRDGCVPRYILIDEIEELHIMMCENCIEELRAHHKLYEKQEAELMEEIKKEREREMLEWDEETKEDYFFLLKHGVASIGEFDEVTKRRLSKKFPF